MIPCFSFRATTEGSILIRNNLNFFFIHTICFQIAFIADIIRSNLSYLKNKITHTRSKTTKLSNE